MYSRHFLVALIVIKMILASVAARVFGWSTPGSVQLGFLLAQGSEFVFVIIAMPVIREVLGEGYVGVVITGIAASLVLTPAMATIGNRLARILRCRNPTAAGTSSLSSSTAPLLVFGMGDVGRMVVDAPDAHDLRYEMIEMDYDRFLAARADGYPVAVGDPADTRLMETLSFAEHKAVIITTMRDELAETLTLAEALKPVMQIRYPNLTRFIAVDTDEEKVHFKKVAIQPVVNRSVPRGLDIAATVLRY